MNESHFVMSMLKVVQELGNSYRQSSESASEAVAELNRLREAISNARRLAVNRFSASREWGEFCWEFPLALNGADEIWMSFEEREHWWMDAKQSAEFWNDGTGQAHSLGALANLYSDMGRLQEAHQMYEKRLKLAEEQENHLAVVKTLLNLGNSHLRQTQHDEARIRLHEARRQARIHGILREEARSVGSLAVTLRRTGKTRIAIRFLRLRLRILDSVEDPMQRALTYANLGEFHMELKEYSDAEHYLQYALKIHVQSRNSVREGTALVKIGQLYAEQGSIASALRVLEKALTIFRDTSRDELARDCQDEITRIRALEDSHL